MPVRQFRIYGQGYGSAGPVTVSLKYNGQIAFSGTTPALDQPVPLESVDLPEVLCTWSSDTDITGEIPVEITATNGSVIVGLTEANYSGVAVRIDNQDAVQWIIDRAPQDYWADVNQNDATTDGKSEVLLNGQPYGDGVNLRAPSKIGDRSFIAYEDTTLSFTLFVDPARVVVETPPFPVDASPEQRSELVEYFRSGTVGPLMAAMAGSS